jgi:hypothetical protein
MIPSPGPKPVQIFGANAGGGASPIPAQELNSDSNAATLTGLPVASYLFGFNGSTWDRIRVANVFTTLTVNGAGNTVVWAPGAGNFFRLMGFAVTVAGTLAAAGVQLIQLLDGANTIKNFNTPLGTTADTQGGFEYSEDMGQGYLSVAAGNDLYINLGTAMATGAVCINCWGTQGATA